MRRLPTHAHSRPGRLCCCMHHAIARVPATIKLWTATSSLFPITRSWRVCMMPGTCNLALLPGQTPEGNLPSGMSLCCLTYPILSRCRTILRNAERCLTGLSSAKEKCRAAIFWTLSVWACGRSGNGCLALYLSRICIEALHFFRTSWTGHQKVQGQIVCQHNRRCRDDDDC